jgi:hypothetical protein
MEPFHRLVQIMPSGCWEWTGLRDKNGYGKLTIKSRRPAPFMAHRLAYEHVHGAIPAGMFVCHTCDNPPCCNPDHLWIGSNRDNQLDASAKGRLPNRNREKTHCPRGHEYSPENTYQGKRGRFCRACNRAAVARLAAKRRAA